MEDGVTVGEALAEARDAVGLTVDEVSRRTKIREAVIRSIERDDFASLGGDLYVRGYLRTIASAVGLDSQPLIREFDAARSNAPGAEGDSRAEGGAGAEGVTEAHGYAEANDAAEAESVTGALGYAEVGDVTGALGYAEASDVTGAQGSAGTVEPAGAEEPPEDEVRAQGSAGGEEPAEASDVTGAQGSAGGEEPAGVGESGWTFWGGAIAGMLPGDPGREESAAEATMDETVPAWAEPVPPWTDPVPWADPAPAWGEPAPMWGERGPRWTGPEEASAGQAPGRPATPARRSARSNRALVRGGMAIFTALVVLGVVGVSGAEIISKLGSGPRHAGAAGDATPAVGPTPTGATAAQAAAGSATPATLPTPTPTAAPAPLARLAVHDAQAFGPDGLADGDNPGRARYAITPHAPEPWRTQWYATAEFGQLKHGTGLLLDMGRRVAVASVQVQLGSQRGADLQIRAGDAASLGAMPVVASRTNAGGLLTVWLGQPVRSRYVLLWFVKLPPTGSGTYRASVYGVAVTGQP